ncbi:MAG: dicarboxylate/amino acid:cation symporter [Holosporales bacterium]|jgi:Na+/H+-dicarboxylate symporter|nr:dicarboxylate/amino acid:cation symporter [Holosporales bacterium]
MCSNCKTKFSKNTIFVVLALTLGILSGLSNITLLEQIGTFCSEIFIRIFRLISMPVISLSVIVAFLSFEQEKSMAKIWKKTLFYTITTTITAATMSAILYYIISPGNTNFSSDFNAKQEFSANYMSYVLDIIPSSIFSAFSEHKVLSVLLISVVFGLTIRFIEDEKDKKVMVSFFKSIHNILFAITKAIVKILPIGLFGFITVSIMQFKANMVDVKGMGGYFLTIILANIIQGVFILPLFLSLKRINPLVVFKAMSSALSVAFFSKSSSGSLPVTMEYAETKLGINPKISRFVLPLCTTINMNGCAAFIFTTVIYVMQNHGIEITPLTMLSWIIIATIAAIGNAGVPMGCFFLSASLLSSMDVPMPLLGIILPIYGAIDMLETSLNVWSDSCVTAVVNKETEGLICEKKKT